jgi:hypothetical protein
VELLSDEKGPRRQTTPQGRIIDDCANCGKYGRIHSNTSGQELCKNCSGIAKAFDYTWQLMKGEDDRQAPPLRTNGDADYRFYSQPEDEYLREGGFSKSPCDTCHQHLAGNRYKVSAANQNTEPIDLEICEDCLMQLVGGYDVKRRG